MKRFLKKYLLPVATFFLAIIFSAEAVPLYTAVQVSDVGFGNNIGQANTSRNVAVAPDGDIFVVFSGSEGIRVAKSIDNGQTFLLSVQVWQGNAEAEIEIASNGFMYISWLAGMDVYFSRSTDDGNTFSTPSIIGSISSGSGVHIASFGPNVYVLERIGRILYTNSFYGVGPFIPIMIDVTRVFSDVRVDPNTGVVYVMTDNPFLRLYTSLDNGTTFTPTTITPGSNVNYSSYTLSVSPIDINMFVFGLTGQAFKIKMADGNSTALSCGISQNSQGRTLASDNYGNLIDGYYNSGFLKYRVSFDQGTIWQPEVLVASGASHNVAINPFNHDVLVVYEMNGQIFVNTYSNELKVPLDVTTDSYSNQTCNSVDVSGTIVNKGAGEATTRGVVYGLNPNPTLANDNVVVSGSGVGSFTATIKGLCPGTTYYARAFAKYSLDGEYYGEDVTFSSPGVEIIKAVDKTVSACDFPDQAAAQTAFDAWLATAGVIGGCSPTSLPSEAGCASQVGFAGDFDPANWTLINTNGGDGSVNTTNAPNSIKLTGSDNWEGGSNYTHYQITVPCAGTISFNWNYKSYDVDGPFFDPFGYTVNGTFTQLTVDWGALTQNGTKSVYLTSGSTFAFTIYSRDQALGAGVEVSSAFTFTPAISAPNCCEGSKTVTWTISDYCYTTTTYSATFTITPITPTLTITLDPSSLWPPNHSMKTINATVVNDMAECGGSIALQSITSNEPDNGLGDGDTPNDIQLIANDDYKFKLRAERAGNGSGRVYTVVYRYTYNCGNTKDFSATVTVPHDNQKIGVYENDYCFVNVHPNPFNSTAVVNFRIAESDKVSIIITNSIGQVVKELVSKELQAGDYDITWNGLGNNSEILTSGVYFITLSSGTYIKTVPITLIK